MYSKLGNSNMRTTCYLTFSATSFIYQLVAKTSQGYLPLLHFYFTLVLLLIFVVLGIEPKALCILDQLHPGPLVIYFSYKLYIIF